MRGVTYTLLGDGPSDRLLEFPIRWVLAELGVRVELHQWADLSRVEPRPVTLTDRARAALEYYPADLLLVHRDAERELHEMRLREIRDAVQGLTDRYVGVVPVHMTEAWLLHDEAAIRRASGNPNGTRALALPSPSRVERESDPKAMLMKALLDASEFSGRRREKLKKEFGQMRTRTAALITDFAPLLRLVGFKSFHESLRDELIELGHLERSTDKSKNNAAK